MSLKTRMIPPTMPANRNICSTPLYEAKPLSHGRNSSPDVLCVCTGSGDYSEDFKKPDENDNC